MSSTENVSGVRRWRRRFGIATLVFGVLAVFLVWLALPTFRMERIENLARRGNEAPTESAPASTFPSFEAIGLLISIASMTISLGGFVTTTIYAKRADKRATLAELRAQEEHEWKKAERVSDGNTPADPE